MDERKKKHIELAFQSQISKSDIDTRFDYEPVLSAHPTPEDQEFLFLGKYFKIPVWISSMTGGTQLAGKINRNLAKVCREFGMGMGLGSCRILLDDTKYFTDFDMRKIIGDDRAFFANLGISQIEQLLDKNKIQKVHDLVHRLQADGLIIHVNPLQEWIQPEGDRLRNAPVVTLEKLLAKTNYPVVVKEVGQGMGEGSLRALMKLPLAAIELAAFGGTNFSNVEIQRLNPEKSAAYEPFLKIGVDATRMVGIVNTIFEEYPEIPCRQIIISGGINTYLDGYYLISKSKIPAIYGQASQFLLYAKDNYDVLYRFVQGQVEGLRMAKAYLRIRE